MRLIEINGPGVARGKRIAEILANNYSCPFAVTHDDENRRSLVALDHIPNNATFKMLDEIYNSTAIALPYYPRGNFISVSRYYCTEFPQKDHALNIIQNSVLKSQSRLLNLYEKLALCEAITYLSSCAEYDNKFLPTMRIELQDPKTVLSSNRLCTLYIQA